MFVCNNICIKGFRYEQLNSIIRSFIWLSFRLLIYAIIFIGIIFNRYTIDIVIILEKFEKFVKKIELDTLWKVIFNTLTYLMDYYWWLLWLWIISTVFMID